MNAVVEVKFFIQSLKLYKVKLYENLVKKNLVVVSILLETMLALERKLGKETVYWYFNTVVFPTIAGFNGACITLNQHKRMKLQSS